MQNIVTLLKKKEDKKQNRERFKYKKEKID